MEQAELDEILKKHKKWLNNEAGGQEANFTRENLNGLDFHKANLCGVSFVSANLRNAILKEADLSNSNFLCANLTSADLSEANLRQACLMDANLTYANLKEAFLLFASLDGANLRNANLWGACLNLASLRRAIVKDTNFTKCGLSMIYLPDGFYQVGGCGSQNRLTTYDSINDRVICGCWVDGEGNHLQSFKKRVESEFDKRQFKTFKDTHGTYYKEYLATILFFEMAKRINYVKHNKKAGKWDKKDTETLKECRDFLDNLIADCEKEEQ